MPICRACRANPPEAPPPKDVRWEISSLGKTPAKHLGSVFAPDAETAIAKAIEELRIPRNLHMRLLARPANY